MTSATSRGQRVLLYEGVGSRPFDTVLRLQLLTRLLDLGYSVGSVRHGQQLGDLGHSELLVLGDFGGNAPELSWDSGGGVTLHIHDIAELDAEDVVELVTENCKQTKQTGGSTAEGWKPWFPVIDYDRCTNCMQCLSFCLFDVYGVTPDSKITVQNQANCKTDCPACSRVCPEVAILFPKYKAGPINGDEISEEDLRREAMKVDISALLGGDIYSMLRDRSAKAKSRFSKERDDERALKERQRCLKKLQKTMGDLDIPPEVLSTLPNAETIQAKAETARMRAHGAVDREEHPR